MAYKFNNNIDAKKGFIKLFDDRGEKVTGDTRYHFIESLVAKMSGIHSGFFLDEYYSTYYETEENFRQIYNLSDNEIFIEEQVVYAGLLSAIIDRVDEIAAKYNLATGRRIASDEQLMDFRRYHKVVARNNFPELTEISSGDKNFDFVLLIETAMFSSFVDELNKTLDNFSLGDKENSEKLVDNLMMTLVMASNLMIRFEEMSKNLQDKRDKERGERVKFKKAKINEFFFLKDSEEIYQEASRYSGVVAEDPLIENIETIDMNKLALKAGLGVALLIRNESTYSAMIRDTRTVICSCTIGKKEVFAVIPEIEARDLRVGDVVSMKKVQYVELVGKERTKGDKREVTQEEIDYINKNRSELIKLKDIDKAVEILQNTDIINDYNVNTVAFKDSNSFIYEL